MKEHSSLSLSPTFVADSCLSEAAAKFDRTNPADVNVNGLSLDEFVSVLPDTIAKQKRNGVIPGSADDEIIRMLEQVRIGLPEMQRYGHVDKSRNYTRNLVATDYKTYTLLLLCWAPNKSSPIHDHPCDGCWMRVVEGQVRETRYREKEVENNEPCCPCLECTQDETFTEDQVVFINDSMGYHKVGNSGDETAVTLHMYSPPFGECRMWLDTNKKSSCCKPTFYSAYGHVL